MIHHRSCSLCEALCGISIEHDGESVSSIRGNPDDVLSRGHICPKAVALQDLHEDPDRLRQPMRREGDRWVPVTWEAAIEEVATRIHHIQSAHGRNAVGVYSGNPTAHNFGALLGNIALREVLGSRTQFSATSVDQLPHMFAALEMFGHQLLLPVPDVDRTRHLVIVGANPAVSNGSLMSAPGIKKRLAAIRARGGRVVVVDPRHTETAALADEHHFIRPNGDAFFFLGVLSTLFTERLVAGGAWREYTRGLDELKAIVARFPVEAVAPHAGMEAETIRTIARDFASAPSGAFYGRLGTTTQAFGGLSAWLLLAINVVTGNLDRPGGMMWTHPPVDLVALADRLGQRGHHGVWRSRVSGLPEFGGELPVAALAEEIETPGNGQVRALMTIAGNPVLSTPNGARLARALGGLEFMVSLDMYVTATSSHAHLILPPLSPLEHSHYPFALGPMAVRNMAKYSPPLFDPPEDARGDFETLMAITSRLLELRGKASERLTAALVRRAQRLGPDRALDLVLRTGRFGALRNLRGPRLSLRALRDNPGGIDLGALRPSMPDRLYTRDQRLQLAPPVLVADLRRIDAALERPPSDDLLLIGRRTLLSNNSWMNNSPRLVRGGHRCVLLMNPEDAASHSIPDGAYVTLRSRVGAIEVPVALDDGVAPGVVSLPHGWGGADKGARLSVANEVGGQSVNDVVDESIVDQLTGTSALSGIVVEVSLAGAAE